MLLTPTAPSTGSGVGTSIWLPILALVFVVIFALALIRTLKGGSRRWLILTIVAAILGIGGVATTAIIQMAGAIERERIARAALAIPASGRLESADGSISVTVPAFWIKMPDFDPTAVVAAGKPDTSVWVIVRVLPKTEYAGTLRDVDAGFPAGFTVNMEGVRASDPEKKPIGPYPALRRRITGRNREDAQAVVIYVAIVETKDAFYYVITDCQHGVESTEAPAMNAVIDSFTTTAAPP